MYSLALTMVMLVSFLLVSQLKNKLEKLLLAVNLQKNMHSKIFYSNGYRRMI